MGGRSHAGLTRAAALVALVSFAYLAPTAHAGVQLTVDEARDAPPGDGTVSPAVARAMGQGYLVPDQSAYERLKASAGPAPGDGSAEPVEPPLRALAPTVLSGRSWAGIFDANSDPSDSTGAVGTTRYVELVNRSFAIYSKTSNTPIATGTLNSLFGMSSTVNSFDPQIIWDPTTSRFYYAGDSVISDSDHKLSFGWSKTASPSNGTSDWCHYFVNFGSRFPDYPKLGDSAQFIIIGANSFDAADNFLGADAVGIGKPPSGTTCPAASTLKFGQRLNLQDATGGTAFTPVPVNQSDGSNVGYIITRTGELPSERLSLHRVTASSTGIPTFSNPGLGIAVPQYTVPADAVQKSPSTKLLDTSDARPTQAVSAADPTRLNNNPGAIWTQHTTSKSGATVSGAEVRWYEINPATQTLLQSGKVTTPAYNFNAAISHDRASNLSTKRGGSSMVMGFTTSSSTAQPLVRMVSKLGTAAQSAPVTVKASGGNYVSFTCAGADNLCRWGDYSAATPDPNPPSGTTGVWLTNQYASGGTSTATANWRTWNWAARP